ncbi:hypothetical protein ACFQ9X_38735 [Catenulispora yoronensis]
MRPNWFAKRSRVLAAAALAVSGAVAGVADSGPAAAAASHKPAPAALHLRNLTLVLNWQIVKGLTETGGPRVGTDTDYNISIYAADGSLLGTQQGNTLINYIDPVTGDIFVHQQDIVKIAGGTFVDSGVVNATQSYNGQQQTLWVQGVSGKLAGQFGVFQDIPVIPVLGPKIWQAADIELAPAGELSQATGLDAFNKLYAKTIAQGSKGPWG